MLPVSSNENVCQYKNNQLPEDRSIAKFQMLCISNMLQTVENIRYNTDDKHCFILEKTVLRIILASINHSKISLQWAGGTRRKDTLHQSNFSYFMHHPASSLYHWNRRIFEYMFGQKCVLQTRKYRIGVINTLRTAG